MVSFSFLYAEAGNPLEGRGKQRNTETFATLRKGGSRGKRV
jgi:hypothetical protein